MKKEPWEKYLDDNIVEYTGKWHKKGKDGKCEPFTMEDLKDILRKFTTN